MDCSCNNCSEVLSKKLIVIIALCAFLTILFTAISIILTIVLYKCKTKPHSSRNCQNCSKCLCHCTANKIQSEEETCEDINAESTANSDGYSSGEVTCNSPASIAKRNTIFMTWVRRAGSSLIGNLKSRIYRRGKILAQSEVAVESEDTPGQNAHNLITGAENDNSESTSCQKILNKSRSTNSLDSIYCDSDELDVEDSVSLLSGQNSLHSHQELVTGKSSYIDDSYPKLALSEPSSLTSNHIHEHVHVAVEKQNDDSAQLLAANESVAHGSLVSSQLNDGSDTTAAMLVSDEDETLHVGDSTSSENLINKPQRICLSNKNEGHCLKTALSKTTSTTKTQSPNQQKKKKKRASAFVYTNGNTDYMRNLLNNQNDETVLVRLDSFDSGVICDDA